MQKTATKAKSSSSYSRPRLQKSTTLSRKYVKRPGAEVVKKETASVAKAPAKAESSAKASEAEKIVVRNTTDTQKRREAIAKELNKKRLEELKAKRIGEQKLAGKEEPKVILHKSVKAPEAVNEPKAQSKTEAAEAKTFKTTAKASDLSKAITETAKKAPVLAKVEKAEKAAKAEAKKAENVKLKKIVETKKAVAKGADTEAVKKAMKSVATMESTKPMKKHRGRRIALAFACSAFVVAALAVFVHLNMPNISVKVAAMQTGIEATYPTFIPRNYALETVSSDKDGKITMKFAGPNEACFYLTEEKSTWDSTAVLNNYVKENYSSNYATMHEQGVTYYSEAGSAAWVNGGILYKITSFGKNLTKEQIRNLVVSL